MCFPNCCKVGNGLSWPLPRCTHAVQSAVSWTSWQVSLGPLKMRTSSNVCGQVIRHDLKKMAALPIRSMSANRTKLPAFTMVGIDFMSRWCWQSTAPVRVLSVGLEAGAVLIKNECSLATHCCDQPMSVLLMGTYTASPVLQFLIAVILDSSSRCNDMNVFQVCGHDHLVDQIKKLAPSYQCEYICVMTFLALPVGYMMIF